MRIGETCLIRKAITFIGRSEVDGINYSSISRNVGITKYWAEAYLRLLEQVFVVQRVFPKGTNVLEVGGKGKGRRKFKGVKADTKLVFPHRDDLGGCPGESPLFLLGMPGKRGEAGPPPESS